MDQNLEGKAIIVTGAGGGIGRESSRLFAASGAHLLLADIEEAGLTETKAMIAADGFAVETIVADVGSESSVERMVKTSLDCFGRLDGAFNNAAVEHVSKSLIDLSLEEWERALRVNLTGVFLCIKHQVPAMIRSGGGSIVVMSSGVGTSAIPNCGEYITAKAGLLGLTRAAAADFGGHAIRVNAILPGVIRTPMIERLSADPAFQVTFERTRGRHLLGRLGEPAEVAELAKWLLSDQSSFVHGASIPVDGGIGINAA